MEDLLKIAGLLFIALVFAGICYILSKILAPKRVTPIKTKNKYRRPKNRREARKVLKEIIYVVEKKKEQPVPQPQTKTVATLKPRKTGNPRKIELEFERPGSIEDIT